MTPFSDAGRNNLREGIRKMQSNMTPAARVRRDFRLGRPAKETETLPLHRRVVWERAKAALEKFRARMTDAKLDPKDATALIVYAEAGKPMKPAFLLIESATDSLTDEQLQALAYDELGRDEVVAVGLMFRQLDRQGGTEGTGAWARFPHPLTGLNEAGVNLLKLACIADQERDEALLKTMV